MQASCSGRCEVAVGQVLTPRLSTSRHRALQAGLGKQGLQTGKWQSRCLRSVVRTQASSDENDGQIKNTEFGYSRKDVLLIGAAFVALGYALYYGAQAIGIEATAAGNYVQIFIFLIICVGYVSTYIFRVANKDMTYTKQLEQYEQRVMQKRLEEMPETERERLMEEVEKERDRRRTRP